MVDYSNLRAAIERLRTFPDELEALVGGMSDAELNKAIAGEWTTRQNVHHVADSHMSAVFRFKKPLTEANPAEIPVYEQDEWARLPDYDLPIAPSLLIIRGLHVRFVALLEALTENDLARTGIHPSWGVVTVADVAARYAEHCDAHMAQIQRNITGA